MEIPLIRTKDLVFEKLLAKWDEIFQRESIFDEIESMEKGSFGEEIYIAPSFKISKNFKVYKTIRKWPNIFKRIFHPIESVCNVLVSEYSKDDKEQELSYEAHDGERKIIFNFKKHTDTYIPYGYKSIIFLKKKFGFTKHIDKYISNVSTIIVNFKFYENSLENENLSINGSEEKVSTLEEYFSAIGKSEFYSHYKDFTDKLESKRVALEKENKRQKELEAELEALKGTFCALDNL